MAFAQRVEKFDYRKFMAAPDIALDIMKYVEHNDLLALRRQTTALNQLIKGMFLFKSYFEDVYFLNLGFISVLPIQRVHTLGSIRMLEWGSDRRMLGIPMKNGLYFPPEEFTIIISSKFSKFTNMMNEKEARWMVNAAGRKLNLGTLDVRGYQSTEVVMNFINRMSELFIIEAFDIESNVKDLLRQEEYRLNYGAKYIAFREMSNFYFCYRDFRKFSRGSNKAL